MTHGTTTLYVISERPSGPVKIGISRAPLARINELQTGNPNPLSLMHQWALDRSIAISWERQIHIDLAEWRLEGEWFDLHPKIAARFIKRFYLRDEAA